MNERVLVTGISGFIGTHLAADLLRRGYVVRGTVRSATRADDVRDALEGAGLETASLEIVEADLGADEGWADAARDCDHVQHVASPFPMKQPRDREGLVPAARDGALRVLDAARTAGARRIVFTSSMVAMMYRPNRPARFTVRESDWTDPAWKPLSPYIVSKTRAEGATWEWARAAGWEARLTTVNPGFVLGPAIDDRLNTSLGVIEMALRGALPAVPPASFPVVDVRDLVSVQIEAMRTPDTGGRRLIAAGETMSLLEMAHVLREALPERARSIPRRAMPAVLVRVLSSFDRSLKSLLADMDAVPIADSAYVTELTGTRFRPAAESVRAAGVTLVARGVA